MSGKQEEEVTLHEEIAAAFAATNAKTDDAEVNNAPAIDALEAKPAAKVDEPAGDPAAAAAPAGDPAAAAAAAPAAAAEGEGGQAPADVKLDDGKAPSSWSPKVREKWAELPEEVRAEIIRREEASVNGVRKLQEEYTPIRHFAESISPYLQEAAKAGLNPAQYVQGVLAAERNLRNPDQNARFEALLGIADSYGIPLRQALNAAAGKELLPAAPAAPQLPREVMQELQAAREFRENFEHKSIAQQVDEFKVGKEFYEDVRETMADLMDAGLATSLDDAYNKACKLNPDVSDVLATRSAGGQAQAQQDQRRAAAAGASVKASGAADIQVDDGDDDSIEATVRKAVIGQSGRV